MKKLRIGIMGAASIAGRLMIPSIKTLDEFFDLTVIASKDEQKVTALANQFGTIGIVGYEALVESSEIDVVYMPLPAGLHEEWVIKCLNAGKHVLTEKALAMDKGSAIRMINLAKEKKLLLMENLMFRYHSQHDHVWSLLNRNAIGEIRLFRAQFGIPPLQKNGYRYDRLLGGGALLDVAPYVVKASQWFLKSPLKVTAATLHIDKKTGVDIHGSASLASENGSIAQVSFGFDNFYQCNYEIWGSTGKITAERAYTPKPDEKPVIVFQSQNNYERREMEADNHFSKLLLEFYWSIQNNDFNKHYREGIEQSSTLTEIGVKAERISYTD